MSAKISVVCKERGVGTSRAIFLPNLAGWLRFWWWKSNIQE